MDRACEVNDLKRVRDMVALDPSVVAYRYDKTRRVMGVQAIHIAAFNGHLEMVQFLLEHGAQMSDRCHQGCTVMMYAVMSQNLTLVDALSRRHDCVLTDLSNDNASMMTYAAVTGNCRMIDWLVNHNLSIHHRDQNGHSPIAFAARNNRQMALHRLIELGADPHDPDDEGIEPILHAVDENSLNVVKYLLDNVSYDRLTLITVAARAAAYNRTEVIQWMDNSLVMPVALFSACAYNHLDMVKAIVKKCQVNCCDVTLDGETMIMASRWSLSVLQWLIEECGCNVGAQEPETNDTVLLMACRENQFNVVQFLIDRKYSSMTERNRWGETPIFTAARFGHTNLCVWLIERASNLIDVPNSHGFTPLMAAARYGHVNTVKSLAMYGADRGYHMHSGIDVINWLQSVGSLDAFSIAVALRNMNAATWLLYNRDFDCRYAAQFAQTIAFAPVCINITTLVHRALMPWNCSTHFMYGPRHRRNVFLLFMIRARLKHLWLPDHVWIHIVRMFGRI